VLLLRFLRALTEFFSCSDSGFFRAITSVVRKMPGYNQQRRGTARTLPNFCVVLRIVCFVLFCVLLVCKSVLYYCHRVATQLQLTNILYHITLLNLIWKHLCVCVCVCVCVCARAFLCVWRTDFNKSNGVCLLLKKPFSMNLGRETGYPYRGRTLSF
jgi:hypothetical protein